MPPPAEELIPRLFLGPALRAQPDRRLVKLVRQGYENAFEEIVRRYGEPLRRYARAIVGGHAEDVTQDAFSKALLALRRDDAEIELRPWLYRIVRNTALNDLRDRPPSQVLEEAIAGERSAAEEVERREEIAELLTRLRALPEPQRAAIVMRELEGLGHEEIAAALGMSGGAARQAIYRARRALRDGLGLLLPLPLLKALLAAGTAEAATGAAAGAAGAGIAVKATAATVLVAGTVGTGVALHERRGDEGQRPAQPPAASAVDRAPSPAPTLAPAAGGDDSPGEGSGDDRSGRRGGEDGRDDDRSGRRGGEDGRDDDRSGRRGGEERDDDRSGPSGGGDELETDGDSGSGSSSPGSSGSGSSGSSESGSSGSDSSGSGSDDD